MVRKSTLLILAALTLLVGTSCSKRFKATRDEVPMHPSWPTNQGNLERSGGYQSSSFRGKLTTNWRKGLGGKPAAAPTLYSGLLVYPESKKKIRFIDVSTGADRGRVKVKGIPQSGVVIADSVAYFALGPRRNQVRAVDLLRNKTIWKREVKDVLEGPIIVDNRLLISSSLGMLLALERTEGETVWSFQADRRLTASASYSDGRIFQPADRGTLYVLSGDDGELLYEVGLDGPIVNVVAAIERVFVNDVNGSVYALDPKDGAVLWKTSLGSPLWGAPTVAHGFVYVGHSDGELVALDQATGTQMWRYHAGEVIKASPLAFGKYLVAGTLRGNVLSLDAATGQLVDSIRVKGAIECAPITDGGRLIVVTQSGEIVCFGESDEPINRADYGGQP